MPKTPTSRGTTVALHLPAHQLSATGVASVAAAAAAILLVLLEGLPRPVLVAEAAGHQAFGTIPLLHIDMAAL